MMAYFDSTRTLRRFDALGGATALFFLTENNALATVNKVESKMLYALFDKGNLDKIYYFDNAKNDAYPVVQLPKDERYMKGFRWDPERKPKGPQDITPLVARSSQRTSYLARPHAQFKETNVYFPGHINKIYKDIAYRDSMAVVKARQPKEKPVVADPVKPLSAADDSLRVAMDSLGTRPSLDSSRTAPVPDSLGRVPAPDSLGVAAGLDSLGTAVGLDSLKTAADSLGVASARDSLMTEEEPLPTLDPLSQKKEMERAAREAEKARRAEEKRLKAEEKARIQAEKQAEREAKWAEKDRKYEERQAAKAQKKLEKERKRKLKALQKLEKKAAKERRIFERYLEKERERAEKKAAKEAEKAAREAEKAREQAEATAAPDTPGTASDRN